MSIEMGYKDIGLRIRTLREANDYTRDVFAEQLDISTKFLYEIELGKKGFSAETLYRISKVLCVSSDYILTGSELRKVPDKIIDILQGFSPEQLARVHEILRTMQELVVMSKE